MTTGHSVSVILVQVCGGERGVGKKTLVARVGEKQDRARDKLCSDGGSLGRKPLWLRYTTQGS